MVQNAKLSTVKIDKKLKLEDSVELIPATERSRYQEILLDTMSRSTGFAH